MSFAFARQIGGDRSAADSALRTLIEKDADQSAYQIAEVYALRNDAKPTFEWLDRAWVNRDQGIQYLLFDPFILRYKGRSALCCVLSQGRATGAGRGYGTQVSKSELVNGIHLPRHRGARFSLNASTPSTASAECSMSFTTGYSQLASIAA